MPLKKHRNRKSLLARCWQECGQNTLNLPKKPEKTPKMHVAKFPLIAQKKQAHRLANSLKSTTYRVKKLVARPRIELGTQGFSALIEHMGVISLAARRVTTFQSLTQAIIHQQLSGKAAGTILGRFLDLFPEFAGIIGEVSWTLTTSPKSRCPFAVLFWEDFLHFPAFNDA